LSSSVIRSWTGITRSNVTVSTLVALSHTHEIEIHTSQLSGSCGLMRIVQRRRFGVILECAVHDTPGRLVRTFPPLCGMRAYASFLTLDCLGICSRDVVVRDFVERTPSTKGKK
jgi:hypothetical protein